MKYRIARLSPRVWNYQAQISLLIISVSLATAMATSMKIERSSQSWLREDLRSHATMQSQFLARTLVAALARDDFQGALDAIRAVSSADAAQRADAAVLGRDNRVLLSSDAKRFPLEVPVSSLKEPLRDALALSASVKEPVVSDVKAGTESYSVLRLPLATHDGKPLGTLLMSYPHSLFARRHGQTLSTVAFISLGFAALLLPLGCWLGRRITQRFARASDALHKLVQEEAAKTASFIEITKTRSAPSQATTHARDEATRLERSVLELRRLVKQKERLHREFGDLHKSLKERESRIRRLVDANIVGILIANADGRVTDANDAYLNMVGYTRADIEAGALNTNDLTPAEYRDAEAVAMRELNQTGQYRPFEKEYLRRDGSRVPVLAGGALLDSSRKSTVAFALDLTERRQAQAEREARRAAELANRAKSEFIATMSHELRTPLNGILGYAQLLGMDGPMNERQRRGINTIRESGEHLLALIQDILDLSRIEAGRLERCPTPVVLARFFHSVVDLMRVKADQKGLVLAFDAAPGLPVTVLVDERHLRQVLFNLLGNAVKFTDRGTVLLAVRCDGVCDGHSMLRIDVSDTGVGVKTEDLPRIFEPFKQVGELRRREAGAGLGLTITRALVLAMGGEIAVRSEPGRGSHFSISLRLQHAQPPVPKAPAQMRPASYDGPRRRILVVDDVAQNRALLADFLAVAGFDLETAEDVSQCIDRARTFRPDLIVMDSVMPGMSGLEATTLLRQDPAFAHLPIIAVSATATDEHRQKCLAAGANECLSKPIRLADLAQAIEQLLQLKPLSQPH